jgi:hypothetical protein
MNITVKVSVDEDAIRRKIREAAEKKMRELIHQKLTFPGSDKLSIKVSFNGEGRGTLTFVGDDDVTKEAIRRWNAK